MKPPPLAMRRGVPVRLPPRGGGRGSLPVGRGQTCARGRGRATSRPVENVEIEVRNKYSSILSLILDVFHISIKALTYFQRKRYFLN